jgi:NADPH-dependent 2,4-dienoyl-CoA reductase/sulfur reductase-like enzyme
MTRNAEIVILGNGGAACHAAMALRQEGYAGALRMISDCNEAAFNPMLGPYYVKGRIGWEACFPFGRDFYDRYDIQCHFGSPVVSLDAVDRTVRCEDGATFRYHRCLTATGAAPSIPPVPGLSESSRALAIRTSASILKLKDAMAGAGNLVVLGASLVGLKLAEIMSARRAQVLLVDVTDQVMPRGAHPIAAAYLQQYLELHGVSVRLGCSLEGLEDEGDRVCCFFPESITEKADFIAVCTGIRPNIGFIDRSQVATDAAILIDRHSRTSAQGLYAAGDCAQGFNPLSHTREWLGTWPNACYQGRAAGRHMAGKPCAYPGNPPQHISPFFDWTYVQIGDAFRKGEGIHVETSGNPFNGAFRLLVYQGDLLIGANLINDTGAIGEIKRSILTHGAGQYERTYGNPA